MSRPVSNRISTRGEVGGLVLLGCLLGIAAAFGDPATRRTSPSRTGAGAGAAHGEVHHLQQVLADQRTDGDVEVVGNAGSLGQEERQRSVAEKVAVLTLPTRVEQLQPGPIVAALGIGPGSVVVDIGAGAGLLSVPLARAVTPDGVVYATDVDARMVKLLREKAADLEISTLMPILVTTDGLDPFYGTKTFDVAVMVSVLEYIRAPIAFFKALRGNIRAGGRVAILQGRTTPLFLASDFNALFREDLLMADTAAAPNAPATDSAAAIRQRCVPLPTTPPEWQRAFNRVLSDPSYFAAEIAIAGAGATSGQDPTSGTGWAASWVASLQPDQRPLTAWLLAHMDARRLAKQPWAALTNAEKAAVRTLNWMALQRWFRLEPPRELFQKSIYRDDRGMRALMTAAGFTFVKRVTTLRAHDFWLFERSN